MPSSPGRPSVTWLKQHITKNRIHLWMIYSVFTLIPTRLGPNHSSHLCLAVWAADPLSKKKWSSKDGSLPFIAVFFLFFLNPGTVGHAISDIITASLSVMQVMRHLNANTIHKASQNSFMWLNQPILSLRSASFSL
ncbi:hypothetical protein DFH08DRAFT_244453 [Mycena albidolilacea]|uniref:Uncharacterized protein n=1 Tax=Mycena albidolilacea TaxID=1033008 RepID=A0AAD7ENI2_9AGAR|nr:hypothetical protein DFH08DRAFT_244453 [Mycena albidolilacea]